MGAEGSSEAAKPKTAAAARALKKREPQVQEDVKTAVFIRGTNTSQLVNTTMKDLFALKKPNGIQFSKRNQVRPFEDPRSLEFFAQKNDASLFVVASHSKKRPHNLVLARSYDYQLLDMVELGVEDGVAMETFKSTKAAVGHRPLILFHGDSFDASDDLRTLKSLFLDFFRGDGSAAMVNLGGIEHVISITADGTTTSDGLKKLYFRVYAINLKKSGTRLPRVELDEMGPRVDFVLRRSRLADAETMKQATRIPKELVPKKQKNIEYDPIGDKLGRIHLGKQDLTKLQTRKIKGLKRRADEDGDADGDADADADGDDGADAAPKVEAPASKKSKRRKSDDF
ncbi:Brix domain-containing protein [Blyttiomyces helicus]|uniref:Ribosome production factor 2 homolog n=1 Tax=Blyttiomyces helicus TaxID=388810 RepID=A0A4P9WIX0_9FUNG|nr:Brix domain-containing protein [Blyttiomyces helicus]|eukprot:RKO91863.1 Brix domain-containing protein [Blyttiomyces helicus]